MVDLHDIIKQWPILCPLPMYTSEACIRIATIVHGNRAQTVLLIGK